jgi:acyl-CoA thioesterase I
MNTAHADINAIAAELWQIGSVSRSGLPRLRRAVDRGGCGLALVGGSVSAGYAASNAATHSIAPRLARDLKRFFDFDDVTAVNAGVGGTDSAFGAFRLGRDVFGVFDPDLLFIEFAVNDDTLPVRQRLRGIEGIVRQARSRPAPPDLCLLYAATRDDLRRFSMNQLPENVLLYEELAAHYDLPSVWMAMPTLRAITQGQARWEDFFVDDVHPNDRGFAQYTNTIHNALSHLLRDDPVVRRAITLPEPLLADPLQYASLVDVSSLRHPRTWQQQLMQRGSGWDLFDQLLVCDDPDAPLDCELAGRSVGVVLQTGPDTGDLLFSIDGGPERRLDAFDEFSRDLTRPRPLILADDLSAGSHRVRLRVAPDIPSGSTGRTARLGLLMQSGECDGSSCR